MHDVKASPGKFIGYALVRDKDGKPKIDDPATLPEPIKAMLTKEEFEEIYNGSHSLNHSS